MLRHRILIGHDTVKNIHRVLLVKDGRLAFEEYFYGTHRNHMHPIQSDTKSVISILMGIAVEKGLIKDVNQPVLDFFPEISPTNLYADKRAITIENLLMMAPGLQCQDSYRYGWRGLSDWAWGHGGQFIFVLPALDSVVVFTAKHWENPGYSKRAFNMLTGYIIPAVAPPRPSRTIVKVAHKVLETYVGTYKFVHDGQTETVNIFLKDNKLYDSGDDEDIVELYPETENQFYGTSNDTGGFKLQFVKDQKGDITNFIFHFAPQFALMSIPFNKVK